MNTEELAALARAAQTSLPNGKWFEVQDGYEFDEERVCSAHITAWSPELALAVLAVVEAARVACEHVDMDVFEAVDNLRGALKALEAV
jgi:hypothetical protein